MPQSVGLISEGKNSSDFKLANLNGPALARIGGTAIGIGVKFMDRFRVLLPHREKLYEQLFGHPGYYLAHWADTLSVSILACLLALVLAGLVAIAGLKYPAVLRIVSPIIAVSQSFPLQALGPVIIIAFGAGFMTKAAIALTITFFPIQSAIVTAFGDAPPHYLLYARVCKANFWTTTFSIRFPFALPRIIAALKTGFTLSVIGAVVAEFISPQGGIGEVLLIAQSSFDVEAIYICLVMLMLQGLTIYLALSWFEQRVVATRSVL